MIASGVLGAKLYPARRTQNSERIAELSDVLLSWKARYVEYKHAVSVAILMTKDLAVDADGVARELLKVN